MSCELRFLDRTPYAELHRALTESFADYALDMSYMTEAVLRHRSAKNGVDLAVSPGGFAEDRLVGLTLVGLGTWEGEPAAFDAATGIVKAYRGQGLAGRLFEAALPALRGRGVKRFLLEVLQENEPAIKAYERTGFRIGRAFDCYQLEEATDGPSLDIRPVGPETLAAFEGEQSWRPSWENSFEAMARIPGDLRCYGVFEEGTCRGAVAYDPLLRWILAVAVRRDHRGRGLGTALLRHAIREAGQGFRPVRANNIETTDEAARRALEKAGFKVFVGQYEMVFEL